MYYTDHHNSDDALVLCPFNILKFDRSPAMITRGVVMKCQKPGECIIRGDGTHLVIASKDGDHVTMQGFTFMESDEHALVVRSGGPTASTIICNCQFNR